MIELMIKELTLTVTFMEYHTETHITQENHMDSKSLIR